MSLFSRGIVWSRFSLSVGMLLLCGGVISQVRGQGPTPETGATLFPGGAFVSYNSVFKTRVVPGGGSGPLPVTVRPTFSHEAPLTFTWGFRRDYQLTVIVPIVTTRFDAPGPGLTSRVGGTGLGDTVVFLKYRFLRLDSERGTTQASVSLGPKLPTGRTNLLDPAGVRLPVGLQPSSGSIDVFFNVSGTYTGLFNIHRLVADESLTYLWRRQGSQQMQLGSSLASRFWLSYRPYQSASVGKEWFIGPALAWEHMADDRQSRISQPGSGGDLLLLGLTTFVSPRAGTHVWFGVDFAVAQSSGAAFRPINRRFSLGITQQFRLHR